MLLSPFGQEHTVFLQVYYNLIEGRLSVLFGKAHTFFAFQGFDQLDPGAGVTFRCYCTIFEYIFDVRRSFHA